MRTFKNILIVAVIMITVICCIPQQTSERMHSKGPQAIIYKTKGDYSKNVPVTLSDDKMKIVSYPAPQDVYTNGKLAYPTELVKGYLLDNRGIGPNTAFLKLTYEEYSKLTEAPNPNDLYNMIIDKNPITHMYNLGSRYGFKDIVTQADSIIEHHKLRDFERLK
jgi:hypothetical protein